MPGDSGGRSDGHGRERGWNIRQPISRHVALYHVALYEHTCRCLFKGDADYVEATVIPPHWAEIGCKQLMMPRS